MLRKRNASSPTTLLTPVFERNRNPTVPKNPVKLFRYVMRNNIYAFFKGSFIEMLRSFCSRVKLNRLKVCFFYRKFHLLNSLHYSFDY